MTASSIIHRTKGGIQVQNIPPLSMTYFFFAISLLQNVFFVEANNEYDS